MQTNLILEPDRTPAQIAELGRMAEDSRVRPLWASNCAVSRDVFMSLVPTDAIRLMGEHVLAALR